MNSAFDDLDAAGFLEIWQHFDADGEDMVHDIVKQIAFYFITLFAYLPYFFVLVLVKGSNSRTYIKNSSHCETTMLTISNKGITQGKAINMMMIWL